MADQALIQKIREYLADPLRTNELRVLYRTSFKTPETIAGVIDTPGKRLELEEEIIPILADAIENHEAGSETAAKDKLAAYRLMLHMYQGLSAEQAPAEAAGAAVETVFGGATRGAALQL